MMLSGSSGVVSVRFQIPSRAAVPFSLLLTASTRSKQEAWLKTKLSPGEADSSCPEQQLADE